MGLTMITKSIVEDVYHVEFVRIVGPKHLLVLTRDPVALESMFEDKSTEVTNLRSYPGGDVLELEVKG